MSQQSKQLHLGKFEMTQKWRTLAFGLMAIGLLTFVIGLMRNQERMWPAYLNAFFFFSCLGLGGLFFTALQHVTNAGWSVTIRRLSEGMAAFIPLIFIGGLVLLFGFSRLYPWADPNVTDPVVVAKHAYLNPTAFVIRLIIFCGGWFLFKKLIVGHSVKQDVDGNEEHTTKNVPVSIGFILFFGLSFSLFSVDLLMSLQPSWYSTIFGIYCFSGLFQASLAVIALILVYFKRSGLVAGYITDEHMHDVAKFMKAFTVFWAYIAFSQFMLIWYANIPEETEYYIMRSQGGWMAVSLGLLIFRFIVPFVALLPRGLKRNENHVILVSCLILVMQYVDIWWMVYPNFFEGQMTFGLWEVGIWALFAGIFLWTLGTFLSKHSLIPIKDPRIQEALNHHVTY